MKRSRDEGSHPVERPADASSFGLSQNTQGESGGVKLTTDDALNYLQQVKLIFQDRREKYDQFLNVMKEFKAQRISTEGVIANVKELFRGHSNLIYGFNTFLPKGYEITLDEDDSQSQPMKVEFKEAIGFVSKVKKHFKDEEHVYIAFLDILNMYRREDKSIDEVYEEITELFEDHPDLLEEFENFLPDNSATTSAPHDQHGRNTFPRYDDRGTPMLPLRRVSSDDQNWRQERVRTSLAERDLSSGLADIDEQRITVKSPKDQRKREKDSRDRRNRILENRAPEHDAVRDLNSQRYSEKKKPAQREGFPLVSYDDRNALKSIYSQEFTFCERVKEKLGNSDDYQAFLKCLHIYSTEIITRTELQNLIADLLGKYPDLMEGFNVFLERCENIDGFLAGVMSKRSLWSDRHLTRSTKSDDKDKESKRDTEATKEKKEKYLKSIQDLDLSKCQRCTPSYRLLPEDYPIHTASQRSELGAQVLNDHWVSVTSGSEDYSFKHMRRNQYEESLFKCEDDRFELDMLIESVSSTAKRAEDLLNNINHNIIRTNASIRVEDHFTAINIRCIERLYGDHGLDALDALRKHPAQSLPAILNRLKQKQDEWTKCRSGYNKIWAEIFAKNHYKSLDHRSFYFKQQDSKTLSMKSFVAEIKQKKENIQKDDSLLFSVAAAYKRPLVPHLELFFPDADVHRDIRKIMKFSCDELCSTKEQINKVMKIWYTLCEPMLGVVCNAEDRHSSNASAGSMEIDARGVSVANDNLLGTAKSNQTSAINGNATARELGSNESNTTRKDDVLSDSQPAMETTSGAGVHDHKHNVDAKQPEVVATRKGTRLDGSRIKRRRKESSRSLKSEKEEGELSPNGDFEEDDSSACWDAGRSKHDAGVDDEESENASEASGESGDDECSGEEHEEGDDAETEELSRRSECGSDADVYHNGQLQSAQFLMNAKPLKRYISSEIEYPDEKRARVFYGNEDFYALFRLHSALYERLLTAKRSSSSCETDRKDLGETSPAHPCSSFMSALFSLLDGSSDNAKFENECQAILGKQAYVLFTLDKLIYRLVKQLQAIAADEVDNKLLQLFEYEASRKPMKSNDSVYHENLLVLPLDGKDKIFRIEYSSAPSRLSIHLMDREHDKSEAFAVSVEPKFSAYLQNDFLSTATRSRKEPSKVFLRRNKRRYSGVDENSAAALAIEDAKLLNGLEYKMFCSTSKIFYVLDTEDFFYQPPGKRRNLTAEQRAKVNLARARRFRIKLP